MNAKRIALELTSVAMGGHLNRWPRTWSSDFDLGDERSLGTTEEIFNV